MAACVITQGRLKSDNSLATSNFTHPEPIQDP
jgi:hypothetical protein